jgi:flavorubredoxin
LRANAFEIREGLHWVGIPDPARRRYEVIIPTPYGTTYNSYLLMGEKTAVIEVADDKVADSYLDLCGRVLDGAKPDYVILDHAAPNHSGSLLRLLKAYPEAEVVTSEVGARFVREITRVDPDIRVVREGDRLDLGLGRVLTFIEAPFMPWPDCLFTWVESERVLFSGEAFGAHFAAGVAADGSDDYAIAYRDFYQAIMHPFEAQVREAVAKLSDLPIEVICPAHGPIHQVRARRWVQRYAEYSARPRKEAPVVAVAYASAYGYTRQLAEAIAKGIGEAGAVIAQVYDLAMVGPEGLARHIEAADGVLIGSPTLNRDAARPVWALLSHVSPVLCRGKPAAAFGSYGWSGEAVGLLEDRLRGLQLDVRSPGPRVKFAPAAEDLERARQYGREFAERVKV